MARTSTKTTAPAAEPMVNEGALKRLDSAATELVLLQDQNDENARALAQQLGYEGGLSVGALEDGIRFYQQRTAEACMELGKRLVLLKETCGHGNFQPRLELLGIEDRAARRFMSAAVKFSKRVTSPVLAAAGGQSKLLELLVLDDSEIAELEDGGTVRGITVDKIDKMGVRELRTALRQSEKDADFEASKRQKAEVERDALEKKLAGNRPVTVPMDERITPLMVEITQRQSLGEKIVVAHQEAAAALDAWWMDEVTQQEGYDPARSTPMPRSVGMVVAHLYDSAERLAALVGRLQHDLDMRFGDDIAEARQYLMQDQQLPEAGDAAA